MLCAFLSTSCEAPALDARAAASTTTAASVSRFTFRMSAGEGSRSSLARGTDAVRFRAVSRRETIELAVTLAAVAAAAACRYAAAGHVVTFVIAAVALAALARLVGSATEQLGARLGSGGAGVVQSALGNLPELFIAIFALRQGLVTVVQAALVGSILANSVLVLGLAFVVGGLRHGTQRFDSSHARMISTLTLLAAATMAIPSLAQRSTRPRLRTDTLCRWSARVCCSRCSC